MKLYHGSNLKVQVPEIIPTKRFLDFGTGFYLTSDMDQAGRWAERTAKSRSYGKPIVSVYEFDENDTDALQVLKFNSADIEWLHYVSDNRKGLMTERFYDIVIGPVADDQVIRTVNLYLEGYLSEDMALQLLLPQRLKDQYAFKTEKALRRLHYEEAVSV